MPRPRFSLLTSLLLVTIVAMAIVIWQLYAEVVPLRMENRRLRDEVGELTIEDESEFHAMAVRTDDEFTWKWRIWIPKDVVYRLGYNSQRIPKTGFPPSQGWVTISGGGEHWIEYRVRRDPRSGKWMDGVQASFGGLGSVQQDWVDWPTRAATGEGVGASKLIRRTRSYCFRAIASAKSAIPRKLKTLPPAL
jgi:hypothetical protein